MKGKGEVMSQVNCPKCHKSNDDNWPIHVKDKVEWGGCQECWEDESSQTYWSYVEQLVELIKEQPNDQQH